MGIQTDYFNRTTYKAVYSIGDRVHGKFNKIPFVGTIGNDTLVSLEEGPYVTVHFDLPLKYKDKVYNFMKLKHKDVKPYK